MLALSLARNTRLSDILEMWVRIQNRYTCNAEIGAFTLVCADILCGDDALSNPGTVSAFNMLRSGWRVNQEAAHTCTTDRHGTRSVRVGISHGKTVLF